MDEDVDTCTREIETHFHEIPADTLAQWLDWSDDIPRVARAEARRLVEDAGLLGWIGEQNIAQGVAPPPQFVWEKAVRIGYRQPERSRERRCLVASGP